MVWLSDLEEILKKIEELRAELRTVVEGKKFTDPKVVSTSQMLDALLNEYQKLMRDK